MVAAITTHVKRPDRNSRDFCLFSFRRVARKPNGHFNRPFWLCPPLGFTNVSAILYLYEPAWRKVWLCDTIFWLKRYWMTKCLNSDHSTYLSYRFYFCWKTQSHSNVECRCKFAHNWGCLQRDDEIFTVVPRPWIQTVNIAVESKCNALINTSSTRSSESGAH